MSFDFRLKFSTFRSQEWDVLVVCAGQEFKGSRNILRRVPFFDAALCGSFQEGATHRVEIHDSSAAAFSVVWHFIYTDDCCRVAELGADNFTDLLDVLSLSKRFELHAMMQGCSRRLAEVVPALSSNKLIEAFSAARTYDLSRLQEACSDRISLRRI